MARRIEELLKAVDDHLDEPLSVKALARMGYLSPVQLYRDFYSATGHTVQEYVRKRRLSKALALIRHTGTPLKDIAYDCGYSSQQSMCRSVKAATGQTPLDYKHGETYFCFPRSLPLTGLTITVAMETMPETLGLAYYQPRLSNIENEAIKILLSLLPGYRGRIFGRNGAQAGDRFCYELYIQADEADLETLQNSVFQLLPPQPGRTGLFAKTTVRNMESRIGDAWDGLAVNWLNTSMFQKTEEGYFEEYLLRDGNIRRLTLYLPVRRRPGIMEIRLVSQKDMLFLAARGFGPDAEANASRAVMDFLKARHPDLAQNARCFYVARGEGDYVCGIKLDDPMALPPDSGLVLLHLPCGGYASLTGECCPAGVYDNVLTAWAEENGFKLEGAPFALYMAENGFDAKQIGMHTLVRLKK